MSGLLRGAEPLEVATYPGLPVFLTHKGMASVSGRRVLPVAGGCPGMTLSPSPGKSHLVSPGPLPICCQTASALLHHGLSPVSSPRLMCP